VGREEVPPPAPENEGGIWAERDAAAGGAPSRSEGGLQAERDITAGRDVAGRDINTTHIGLSESAILRLLLIVGLLVFFATACSFTAGAAAAATIMSTLQQPSPVSFNAAQQMEQKLAELSALPPGAPFTVQFSETEVNSYFHFKVADSLGLENGQARLVGDDQLAVTGGLEAMGGRQVMAIFDIQPGEEQTLHLASAAVQVLNTNSPLGWAAVPTFLLKDMETQANETLAGNYIINHLEAITLPEPGDPAGQPGWLLSGVSTE
jgi:hypothetical protein